jgi:hypothetical protein
VPNTLAHLGVHAVLTRGLVRGADISAIWLGYLLPDFPWIAQRALKILWPGIPAIDLRLYATVQSAMVFCLIGAAACALWSRRPARILAILSIGSLLHLLLDASQTKWANGVVLFAPLDWRLLNLGLYWPEDPMSLWLSLFGLGYVAFAALRIGPEPIRFFRPSPRRQLAAVTVALFYGFGPLVFLAAAESADVHFAGTLRAIDARAGQEIGFDRADLRIEGGTAFLDVWTGERLRLVAVPPGLESGKASVQGTFLDAETIAVEALHWHPARLRQQLSVLGLALILLWWGWGLVRARAPDRS